ncbi:hypothetical protein CAPTEDRAFT_226675 [Capitella teleta]|uniref:Uncharacterized protein n=1 Tax=Capitella teleta TaxID=283909 RepID=R7U3I1_CAPTE|nr:hypothetical protein CAPTEDRAFT_226675 [Capitella teleta]|eukprot:ELT97730.1 hypothetical protein CAPTEDRAFT_226675 [Capitella teleta]
MALSVMRTAFRPSMLSRSTILCTRTLPMTTSAQQDMKDFWKKNQQLNRPNSPWMVYEWHFPMLTSLGHRFTGIGMGVALYGLSFGLFFAPGDFTTYLTAVQGFGLSPYIMFPAKAIMAFPLMYHYLNGIRHLSWDAGYGYKLGTQYRTGAFCYITAAALAALVASLSYLK